MARAWAWLGAPIVIGHAGCIASPAAAMALGMPVVMPICGGGPEALLPVLGPVVVQAIGSLAAVAILLKLLRFVVGSGCATPLGENEIFRRLTFCYLGRAPAFSR